MKTRMAIAGLFLSAVLAMAGPSAPAAFNQSITRQDFTGQGTYHRQGLIRQQQHALAAQAQASGAEPAPRTNRPGWMARLWQSLFPPRTPASSPSSQ